MTIRIDDKVVIHRNPHQCHAVDIVGTVVRLRPGEGLARCDLLDIQYTNPADGKPHVLPFSADCLEPTHPGC